MNQDPLQPKTETARTPAPNTITVMIIYVLYLLSLALVVTAVVGVVLAYIFRGSGPPWIEGHYRFLIRTFWIGILYGFIALLLIPILLGYIIALLLLVWLIIRCVKGLSALNEHRAPSNIDGWMF